MHASANSAAAAAMLSVALPAPALASTTCSSDQSGNARFALIPPTNTYLCTSILDARGQLRELGIREVEGGSRLA